MVKLSSISHKLNGHKTTWDSREEAKMIKLLADGLREQLSTPDQQEIGEGTIPKPPTDTVIVFLKGYGILVDLKEFFVAAVLNGYHDDCHGVMTIKFDLDKLEELNQYLGVSK